MKGNQIAVRESPQAPVSSNALDARRSISRINCSVSPSVPGSHSSDVGLSLGAQPKEESALELVLSWLLTLAILAELTPPSFSHSRSIELGGVVEDQLIFLVCKALDASRECASKGSNWEVSPSWWIELFSEESSFHLLLSGIYQYTTHLVFQEYIQKRSEDPHQLGVQTRPYLFYENRSIGEY